MAQTMRGSLVAADAAVLAAAPARIRVEIAADIGAVEADWRALEQRASVSPYQRFDFVAAWAGHAAAGAGIVPRVGVVRGEAGQVVGILPFGLARGRVAVTARYLGGSHVNINMPLFEPAFLRTADRATMEAVLDAYCRAAGADGLSLSYQPERWMEADHPFLTLPRQPSSDSVRRLVIEGPYAQVFEGLLSGDARSKLRRKEKRIADAGVRIDVRPVSPACIDALVPAFQHLKAKRLASMGADDPFSEPGVGAFLREAALAGLAGTGGLELHSLQLDGEIVAVRGVVRHGEQLSLLMQAFDLDHPMAKYSLGEVLMAAVIASAAASGVRQVDFGVGDMRYKDTWSNAETQMFDITRAVTLRGAALSAAVRARTAAVRAIKQNKPLYAGLKAARARLAGLRRR